MVLSSISTLIQISSIIYVVRKASNETVGLGLGTIDGRLQELQKKTEELSRNCEEACDPRIAIQITDFANSLRQEIIGVNADLLALQGTYTDMCNRRTAVQTGTEEEANALLRIKTELDSLAAMAIRISDECEFIKEERSRLELKLASEFSTPPLMELLQADFGQGNPAWQKLYNRASIESSYN